MGEFPGKALSTRRFFNCAISPFSPRTALRADPMLSNSASIRSSLLVSFFSLVILPLSQIMTRTQTSDTLARRGKGYVKKFLIKTKSISGDSDPQVSNFHSPSQVDTVSLGTGWRIVLCRAGNDGQRSKSYRHSSRDSGQRPEYPSEFPCALMSICSHSSTARMPKK